MEVSCNVGGCNKPDATRCNLSKSQAHRVGTPCAQAHEMSPGENLSLEATENVNGGTVELNEVGHGHGVGKHPCNWQVALHCLTSVISSRLTRFCVVTIYGSPGWSWFCKFDVFQDLCSSSCHL